MIELDRDMVKMALANVDDAICNLMDSSNCLGGTSLVGTSEHIYEQSREQVTRLEMYRDSLKADLDRRLRADAGPRVMRVIDALVLPEVASGKKWLRLPVPVLDSDRETVMHSLPTQTIAVDPASGRLCYCDGIYDTRAARPSRFGGEFMFTLSRLLGPCQVVDAEAIRIWESDPKPSRRR